MIGGTAFSLCWFPRVARLPRSSYQPKRLENNALLESISFYTRRARFFTFHTVSISLQQVGRVGEQPVANAGVHLIALAAPPS